MNPAKRKELYQTYKTKQEQLKQQTHTVLAETEEVKTAITRQLNALQHTFNSLKTKAEQYVADCKQSLEENTEKGGLIDMGELSAYLKAQKSCLKQIASQQSEEPTQTDLQRNLIKGRVESALRQVRKHQLEQQIRFVEQNVLHKDTVIYDATSSITVNPTEDKQQTERLQQALDELQRVIQLTLPDRPQSDHSQKVVKLDAQEKRLRKLQTQIVREREAITEFRHYIQGQQLSLDSRVPLPHVAFATSGQAQTTFRKETVDLVELQNLLDWEPQIPKPVAKLTHSFMDNEEKIQELKATIRKLERKL